MCSDKWARISKVRNKDSGVTLPTISIITPSFNQAEFLEECIESVLGQGYPHLEYVIMDGGSTDGSIEIIKKHEKHLAYWQSCPDGGQYRAVAEGFLHTTGEIMAWINSDDKYHPLAFAKAACVFADNPAIRWLTGRMSYWNADGDLDRVAENLPPFSRRKGLEGHFNKPYIQQESTFWRRSLWEESGSELSSSLKLAGDLELWVRFFRFASLHTVDTLLGGYRYHGLQRGITQADGYFYEACAIMEKERQACSTPDSALPPPPPVITLSRERLAAFTAACGISPEPPSARSCWRHYTENLIAITNRLMREKRPEQSGFFRNEMMLFGLAKPSAVSLTADRLDELAELQRQVQTLNEEGVAYAAQGDGEQALAAFRKAIALAPSFSRTGANLVQALWQRGERREALEQLAGALSEHAHDRGVVQAAAEILAACNAREQAREVCNEYLSYNPHDEEIRNLLLKIGGA